jgi:hypothetical protein
MPRCKCQEACFCELVSASDCIVITGVGTAVDPYVIDALISPDALNELTCELDGLYMEGGLYVADTDCITLDNSAPIGADTGTWEGPLFGDWIIDPDPCNVVECRADSLDPDTNIVSGAGLYAPGGPLEYCWCLTEISPPSPFNGGFGFYSGELPDPDQSPSPDFLVPPGCWRVLLIGEAVIEWDPIQVPIPPGAGIVSWAWNFFTLYDDCAGNPDYPSYIYPTCWGGAVYTTYSRVDSAAIAPPDWLERKTLIYKTSFDIVNTGAEDISISLAWTLTQFSDTNISGAIVSGAWLNAKLGAIPVTQDPNPCSECVVYYPYTTTTSTTTTTTTTTSPIAPPPSPLLYGDVQSGRPDAGDFFEFTDPTVNGDLNSPTVRATPGQTNKDLANAGDVQRLARAGSSSNVFREFCMVPACVDTNMTYPGDFPGGLVWAGGDWLYSHLLNSGPITQNVLERLDRFAGSFTVIGDIEDSPADPIDSLTMWWQDGRLFLSGRAVSAGAIIQRIYEIDPTDASVISDNGAPFDGVSSVRVYGASEHPLSHVTYVVYLDPLLNSGDIATGMALGTMDPDTAVITPLGSTALLGVTPRGITSISWTAPNLWAINGEGGINPSHLYRTVNGAADTDYALPAWGILGAAAGGGDAIASDRVSLLYHLYDYGDSMETIDPDTAVITPIVMAGTPLIDPVSALSDDGGGDFFAATTGPNLFSITAAGVRVGLGGMDERANGLAMLNGDLYAIDFLGDGIGGTPQLRTLDQSNGATLTNIGLIGPSGDSASDYRFYGLAEMGSILYASYRRSGSNKRRLASIDHRTGQMFDFGELDRDPAGVGPSLPTGIAWL